MKKRRHIKKQSLFPCPDCGTVLYLPINRPVLCSFCGNFTIRLSVNELSALPK